MPPVTTKSEASSTMKEAYSFPFSSSSCTPAAPDSRPAAIEALREASRLPLFFAFVGFGNNIRFLEELDTLGGRTVDNASFFHARDPHRVSDSELYDGLTGEFAQWLTAARTAGIVR